MLKILSLSKRVKVSSLLLRLSKKVSLNQTRLFHFLELKLYKAIPANGLAIFCGVILMEDGKTEKKVTYDLEPYKPLHANIYRA